MASRQATSKHPHFPPLERVYRLNLSAVLSHQDANCKMFVIFVLILVSRCRLSPIDGCLYVHHEGGCVFLILCKELYLMIMEYIYCK